MNGLDFTLIFVAAPEKHSQHGLIPYGEVLCVYSTCTCKFDDLLPNNLEFKSKEQHTHTQAHTQTHVHYTHAQLNQALCTFHVLP